MKESFYVVTKIIIGEKNVQRCALENSYTHSYLHHYHYNILIGLVS